MSEQNAEYGASLEALINEYEAYLEFLNEANEGPIGIAYVHGWRCPEVEVQRGKDFRLRLIELRKAARLAAHIDCSGAP